MERVHRFVQNRALLVAVLMHQVSAQGKVVAFSQVKSVCVTVDGLEDYEKCAILHISECLGLIGVHVATIGAVAIESLGGARYRRARSMSSWREWTPSFA